VDRQVGPPTSFIKNGDFTNGTQDWTVAVAPGCAGTRTVTIVSDAPYGSVAELKSVDAGACGGGCHIRQPVTIAVDDYSTITLTAMVKLISSSVAYTCGLWGSETPVILSIHYAQAADGGGTEKELRFTCYYSTGAAGETCATPTATTNVTWAPTKLTQNVWAGFSSGNLKQWIPAGSTITQLDVYGQGWDYLGRVTKIQIVGQP
jgi:hypothetical protein